MALVDDLRGLVGAAPDEYSVGNVGYWSDTQLTAVMQAHRELMDFERIDYLPRVYGGGSVEYKRARVFSNHSFEAGSTGGTIQDGLGGTVTGWTLAKDGHIDFTANTAGSAYYLTAWGYDLHAAAADVLDQWASAVKLHYDVDSDDQRHARNQKVKELRAQAAIYRKKAVIVTGAMKRDDAIH